MKVLLRWREEGVGVLEVDPERIVTIRINVEDNGEHVLLLLTESYEFEAVRGTFTACDAVLKKLHNILDVHLIDV